MRLLNAASNLDQINRAIIASAELGYELWVDNPTLIRAAVVRKQKTSPAERDERQLWRHRQVS